MQKVYKNLKGAEMVMKRVLLSHAGEPAFLSMPTAKSEGAIRTSGPLRVVDIGG